MDFVQKLNVNCLAMLLLVFAHITKRLLRPRSRFSRRIGLGFLTLVLLVSSTTPAAYAQAMKSDTLVNTRDFPIFEIFDMGFGLGTTWQDVTLTREIETRGFLREIILVFDCGGLIDPNVAIQVFAEGQSQPMSEIISQVVINENLLWIKLIRKGERPIDPKVRIRIPVARSGSDPTPLNLVMMDGIVIVDNINGYFRPVIGPIKDIVDPVEWVQYYNMQPESETEVEEEKPELKLFPNPVSNHFWLTEIPVSATRLVLFSPNGLPIMTVDLDDQPSLKIDMSLVGPGSYQLMVLIDNVPTFLTVLKP